MREWKLYEHLLKNDIILSPLLRDSVMLEPSIPGGGFADAFLTARLSGDISNYFNFLVETKSRSTPQIVHQAISQIRNYVSKNNDPDIHPMIMVPFLSEEMLKKLESEQVSGIDLCGNGVITIPNRLLIYRTGNKNLYPDSRPVSNPFKGKSAIVGRSFLTETVILADSKFNTLGKLRENILNQGIKISLAQVSKAVAALQQESIVGSEGRSIYLLDPDKLMKELSASWKLVNKDQIYIRLPDGVKSLKKLNNSSLDWAVTGASSVNRYANLAQSGPLKVAVSDLSKALGILNWEKENVPNFADIELIPSTEPAYYYANEKDDSGVRWANKLQVWVELNNGDARQRDVAKEIHNQIIA
jgi:hypothetical protein